MWELGKELMDTRRVQWRGAGYGGGGASGEEASYEKCSGADSSIYYLILHKYFANVRRIIA